MWDHPRSRGVYMRLFSRAVPYSGSSPLARGLPACPTRPGLGPWIIPARAGFTNLGLMALTGAPDHPRSRGVYATWPPPRGPVPGSSPLARGLHPCLQVIVGGARIIPARAGFTHLPSDSGRVHQDHPRSRGVYRILEDACREATGSSPLARGLRHPKHVRKRRARIIPARAGFTGGPSPRRTRHRDHPRSRGVYSSTETAASLVLGSSPLARGLPPGTGKTRNPGRIIPARAGFTGGVGATGLLLRDHPRSRGVYDAVVEPPPAESGSSPLARGLLIRPVRRRSIVGIIPARAGFTSIKSWKGSRLLDHPRSRGVYPGASRSQIAYVWIIPARAGFTLGSTLL